MNFRDEFWRRVLEESFGGEFWWKVLVESFGGVLVESFGSEFCGCVFGVKFFGEF